jgi:hypothetical protein
MNNVTDVLNKGWTISDVTTVLACGKNDEGRGFLVTLVEPKNHMLRKVYLPYSPETEALLAQEATPLVV